MSLTPIGILLPQDLQDRGRHILDTLQGLPLERELDLAARPVSALRPLNIRYVYELIRKSSLGLFRLPNFGEKSVRKVKEKLATLGLTSGMTLEDDADRTAVVANRRTRKG